MDRFGVSVVLFALGLWLLGGGSAVWAQTPSSCNEAYAQAENAYYSADFDAAEEALRDCLDQTDVSDSMRVRAYRLLSFVHLGQNDREAARLAVESLLDLRPAYEPDPATDRPDFVELVREVKESRETPESETSADGDRRWLRWVAGGAGVAALGTAAAFLFGGGGGGSNGGPEPLPRPDTPPQ